MEGNEIRIEMRGSLAVVEVKGDVTRVSQLFVQQAYRDACGQGAQSVLLKFGRNTYFNSEGIKVLLEVLAEARKSGRPAGITGVSKHFRKIFGMVGITRLATVFDTAPKALEEMEKGAG